MFGVQFSNNERGKMPKKKRDFDLELFNRLHPIGAMTVYPKGSIVLHRRPGPPRIREIKRGAIKEFSNSSRQRLALIASEANPDVDFESFITLTYGLNYPTCGKEVKRHLHTFLNSMKSWLGPFDYIWFFEFQSRGAPHIHIISNLPPPGTYRDRMIMARIWVDVALNTKGWEYCRLKDGKLINERKAMLWFTSRIRQWEAVRDKDAVAKYAVKYAFKVEQKEVPEFMRDIGRFWGCSARVKKVRGERFLIKEEGVRKILSKTRPKLNKDAKVLPKVIFNGLGNVSRETIEEKKEDDSKRNR